MTSSVVELRPGDAADGSVILELWDQAIDWLVARGQLGQWGAEPASSLERARQAVRRWADGPGVTIAEFGGEPVGVSVVGARPPYAVPIDRPETYIEFLVSSRRHAGLGIGSALVARAAADARIAGSEVLRVDCWAEAPTLVAWYEQQGFARSGTFSISGWLGQVFELDLRACGRNQQEDG